MKFRAWLFFAGGVLWMSIPVLAAAQGLVPCNGLNCDLCSVGQLIQNIINFLVGISIPIAVSMFGYAGVLIFTAVEKPANRERGLKIFQSVFIGFLFVIAGWLIVQTILSVLVRGDFFIGGDWNDLQCVDPEVRNDRMFVSVSSFIDSVLGTPPVIQPDVVPTTNRTCEQGYVLSADGDCKNAQGNIRPAIVTVNTTGGNGGTLSSTRLQGQLSGTQQYVSALQNICSQEGLRNCNFAQAIMAIESGGNAQCSNKNACGLMQVIPSTARVLEPSLRGLSDAQIRQRLNSDPTLGMTLGVRYLAQHEDRYNGDTAKMAAAYNGGPGAVMASVSCPGVLVYQCTSVRNGYGETRNYVPNVHNALALINNQ